MAASSSQSMQDSNIRDPEPGMRHILSAKDQNVGQPMPMEKKDLNWYLPLHKAAITGDWEIARKFFDQDPEAVTAKITQSETALHIAVGTGKAINFMKELLELIPLEALPTLQDYNCLNALHWAAAYANVEAAQLLVNKNPALSYSPSNTGFFPIHFAAFYANKDVVSYLLTVTRDDIEPNPFKDESGVELLNLLIVAEFYDLALCLIERYPKLATMKSRAGSSALSVIAGKPLSFRGGSSLTVWGRFIYSWCQKLHATFWKLIEHLAPYVKSIRDTKLMHQQALQLVRCLCIEVSKMDYSTATSFFGEAIVLGATLGNNMIVEEILESFPSAVWARDQDGRNIFLLAVENRRENIFNLLYQVRAHKGFVVRVLDKKNNNILHLAGKLAPPSQLNLVSGAALQMQRELQWYKEVEKYVLPDFKDTRNSNGRSPADEFFLEHKDLVKEGEKWMKDTATSCTIAAALIATIAFAAAITVPGGNNGNSGFPIFSKEPAFNMFAVSDALSLFSSTASLLMFLSILTARYAENDFLFSLPRRLIIGLATLFLSITSMMTAFSATIYLVFGDEKAWTIVPIAAFACLPVTFFVTFQFPLLVDVIRSTYGPGIFGKRSNRILF